jgi:penicillin-binding protein 1C
MSTKRETSQFHVEQGMPEEREDSERPLYDDDVPFHLPMSENLPEEEPLPDKDDDTEELWGGGKPPQSVSHNMPTMPIPREPGVPDPKQTLPGSGGLDPNPDFEQPSRPDVTMRHEPVRLDMTQPNPGSQQVYNPQENQRFQRPPQPQSGQQYQYIPPAPTTAHPAQQGASKPALPRRQEKRKRILGCSPGCLGILIGFIAIFCGGMTLLTVGVSAWAANRVGQLIDEQQKRFVSYKNFQSTFFYDRTGQPLYESFDEGRRINVKYEEFPQSLIDATVAIEDDNFWTNPGIDPPATLRAFAQYVGLAKGSSGGSTITQQIVRNVLFDYKYRTERSIQRKIEEIVLAVGLTQREDKKTILAMYLNEIYYGNLAYGAEAAAQTFFGKHVKDLTLAESALLAGLPQAPADLDPLNLDPKVQETVYQRWRQVLDRMVVNKFITPEQRNEALQQGYTLASPTISLRAPHFTVYAQKELEGLMGELGYSPEDVARGGWKVYTTVDLNINDMAQQAARDQVAKLAANRVSNAAVIVLKPLTGEILGMVGSIDYNNEAIKGKVNVTIALRQPGSTMKPFTYSAYIESGGTPGDVIWDTPVRIGIPGQEQYVPVNYDGAFHGPLTMRRTLANSYNIPAVQTLRRIGVDRLLEIMHRFGVSSLGNDASQYGLSLTLGGGEVSLVDLSNAYAVFANQGVYVPTTSILCILDTDDNVIYQYENGCPRGNQTDKTVNRLGLGKQVLDPRIAFLMGDILADNNARADAMGLNSPLNTGNIRTSVKTGTTNDYKDNWTVGFTRNVLVGVWAGNNDGTPMVRSSGLTGAAPIWNSVINAVYNNSTMLNAFQTNGQLLPDKMDPPPGISLHEICDVRRLKDPATDCPRMNEWMLDTPAGIPDENGNLVIPPAPQQPQQPAGAPQLTEVSPGVFQVLAFRLNPGIASSIQFSVSPGQPTPPPPIYCQVPPELAGAAAGAQAQLFIAPPPVPEDAVAAENYARSNGLAFLPTITCTPELLQGGGGAGGPTVAAAFITSPKPGDVLNAETPIMGTVQFSPDQAKFYKLEVRGGNFSDWVTIGTTHSESVVNGQLENLYVPGLAPGDYVLRLVIVDNGGGFLQAPYEVPFRVG